jgi:hypothetical protein
VVEVADPGRGKEDLRAGQGTLRKRCHFSIPEQYPFVKYQRIFTDNLGPVVIYSSTIRAALRRSRRIKQEISSISSRPADSTLII